MGVPYFIVVLVMMFDFNWFIKSNVDEGRGLGKRIEAGGFMKSG